MTMKKTLWVIGLALLFISSLPIFLFIREDMTWNKLQNRYEVIPIPSAGERLVLPITLLGHTINFTETPTGEMVESIYFSDQGMQKQEVVSLQLFINEEAVAQPVHMVPVTRFDQERYYNWVALFQVNERETNTKRIAIVQRTSPDAVMMSERTWRVIWLDESGVLDEVHIPYKERSEHLLETRLINSSGTALMSMGFYSDIAHFWPNLFFPILYPGGTLIASIVLLLAALFTSIRRRKVVT